MGDSVPLLRSLLHLYCKASASKRCLSMCGLEWRLWIWAVHVETTIDQENPIQQSKRLYVLYLLYKFFVGLKCGNFCSDDEGEAVQSSGSRSAFNRSMTFLTLLVYMRIEELRISFLKSLD